MAKLHSGVGSYNVFSQQQCASLSRKLFNSVQDAVIPDDIMVLIRCARWIPGIAPAYES